LLQQGRPAEALEVVRCQRLVKGYGDTHERGLKNFELLRGAWRAGADAATLARLRDAALADEHGHALNVALKAALKALPIVPTPAAQPA
jgi:indolepyruvate ferredoxin oxidoreductase, beta subunit